MPDHPNRRTTRLRLYDYRWAGAYYVTICTHDRACTLGDVLNGQVELSPYGIIAQEEWLRTPQVRPYIVLDAFVIMPNHIHGVLINTGRSVPTPSTTHAQQSPNEFSSPLPHSLRSIIGSYKSAVTRRANQLKGMSAHLFWQSRFYDHVVRDEQDLERIRVYIEANPSRWEEDEENTFSAGQEH